ncbi:hypothetical protein AL471_014365 [Vibrio alginolyticus]|uniref:hypothetical protein n=1 Tax=Vibrio alginolyticus TaxID=663 RepID=UPI00076C3E24|nr:hypothetical protein [Vibrio alginolyticus]PNP21956.1 hypothetical protein AL471_014365 [Vibrio alginolyticus]
MSYYMHNPFQSGIVVVGGNGGEPEPAYDFIMTVGKPSASGYYGFAADTYGDAEPMNWGNSDTAEITMAVVRPSAPYFIFRATEMLEWNNYANIRLKFFTETESVETTVSNGFVFAESTPEYDWNDVQGEVSTFLRNNNGNDVFVKVLDASLEVNDTIEITIGLYEGGSYDVWGYRSASNTGATSSTYNSSSAIETCYVRDYYYGMALQSELDNEYWNGWEYITATWKFDDGTSHEYAGRLLMHPDLGFYTSSVIDDELIALAQSNIDKVATITLSQAEPPSNVIEIAIGEVEIGTGDVAYGLRAPSSTGELISGEFPDASPVTNAYARTDGYGCLVGGAFERSYWNYLDAITVTWEFEDETSYEFPEPLEYYYNTSTKESFYKSDYIDDTLIEMMSSRVGQTAKIIVSGVTSSKLIAHLQWELDEAAKA